MRKKFRKLLATGFCVIFMLGMTVHAEGNTEFHVETQEGKAGDTVVVPIEFNTGQEVGGFQISVYYDSEMLEFHSLEPGDLIEESGGGIFDYNHIVENSEIIIVYAVADTVKDLGSVVDITFVLKQDCSEELPIGIGIDQMVDASEQSNAVTGVVSGVSETFQEQVMQQRGDTTTKVIPETESAFDGSGETVANTEQTESSTSGTAESEETSAQPKPEEQDGQDSRQMQTENNDGETTEEAGWKDSLLTPIIILAAAFLIVAFGTMAVILKKESRRSRKNRKSGKDYRE